MDPLQSDRLPTAVELGVSHIDTSDYYERHVVNDLIRQTLFPYPDDLALVTKVGYELTGDEMLRPATCKSDLVQAVHDNLKHLGADRLDIVNLRMTPKSRRASNGTAEPFSVLADLQRNGLIEHLGISNVSAEQLTQARSVAPAVCVRNRYSVADRTDDPLVDTCSNLGIAYMPFGPLTGATHGQTTLRPMAQSLGATPAQIALAWLMQRSPTMMPIPGTSSVAHIRENVASANIKLAPHAVTELNNLADGR